MGHIAWQTEDGERALALWSEALTIASEMQNAQVMFHTAWTLGQAYANAGRAEQARQLLQLAVQVGKAAGFSDVQQVEEMLRRLPPT